MTVLFADVALLPDGWAEGVRIAVSSAGDIEAVERGAAPAGAGRLGLVLPGMPNVHGHAFQRAMAGLTERLGPGESSFWSWREVMYGFLARIGPEEQRAIAAQLYVELLKAGCTAIGEFHYLHHRPDGGAYDDPAAMSWAIVEAARETGIGLTLLPALYRTGGFGGRPPDPGQGRFLLDPDAFAALVERLHGAAAGDPQLRVGIAPHSPRAVPDPDLRAASEMLRRLDSEAPVHIHVAEQMREVRECLEWCGARPVRHLFDAVDVDSRWCLVHATHMDDEETTLLARSGAVAGLCPTTEANLGDGLFNLAPYLRDGGRFGIGSDSHVSTSPVEELRWLEYGQRLNTLRRTVAASAAEPHCGARLWRAALAGGARPLGRPLGRIAPGCRADLLALDPDAPILAGRQGDALLDSLVFSGNANPVCAVMTGGRWVVTDGRHPDEERIAAGYRRALARLG